VADDIRSIAPHVVHGGVLAFHDAAEQRSLGMLVHERYHGDGKKRLYGVTEAINNAQELSGFNLVDCVPATRRPAGAPTPVFGGLKVLQRRR
jgi:hypothetical protein